MTLHRGCFFQVLRAISYNPFATRFTLSHNELGDDGLIRLCSGILELRRHGRMLAPLRELNLCKLPQKSRPARLFGRRRSPAPATSDLVQPYTRRKPDVARFF